MTVSPLPADEDRRLQDLMDLEVLDTPAEQAFDDLAALAQTLADAPVALISLVDVDRQWFKACIGLDVTQTPREASFCGHAILQDRVMWVEDTREDARFANNALVLGEPFIRFYAGAPLVVRGSRIGTLCVIGPDPKLWDEHIAGQLTLLARLASERLEIRRELLRRADANEAPSEAVIRADADGRVKVWNPAAEALLGYAAADTLGHPLSELLAERVSDEQRREDRYFRLLVRDVVDYAIYRLDPNGIVGSWNTGAATIKGYDAAEVIGQHFSCFYTEEDRLTDLPGMALRRAKAAGRFEGEGWRVRKDGSRLWASVVIEPIYDEGQFIGFAKITRDMSRQHAAHVALTQAVEQAEAANRAKSEFLANMSHEIRTPLNGVVGVADVLMQGDLSPQQREMTQIISSSAKTLEQLIGNILDLARIESGQTELCEEPFDLMATVASTTALARLKAEEQGLTFRVDDRTPPGAWVVGDRLKLQQILTNLLGNAVKFTTTGGVTLAVSMADDAAAQPQVRFEVRDTGIGFDPADKALIFGRFQQADGSITRRFGGSGLGMAISEQLANLMGATLDCHSTPGAGATFVLSAPLRPCEAAPEAPAPGGETPVMPEPRQLQVLVVDDHPTNRKVCELILSQIGAEVMSVEDGAQAVEAFKAGTFDLILMDIQMPVMDGLTAVKVIRGLEASASAPPTPIFMITANALPEHVEQARLAGADRHIAKPITAPGLLGAIATTLDAAAPSEAQRNAG